MCEAGGVLEHAYFPDGAVLSLLTALENGAAIETANIGREGAFGLFASMYCRTSFNRTFVQLEGGLLRVIATSSSAIPRRCWLIQQEVACNSVHTTQERMSGWLH